MEEHFETDLEESVECLDVYLWSLKVYNPDWGDMALSTEALASIEHFNFECMNLSENLHLGYEAPQAAAPQKADDETSEKDSEVCLDGLKSRCPVQILASQDFGRHLVASRDIEKGEIIICEPPIVLGPKVGDACCIACLKPIRNYVPCPNCGLPLCSTTCTSGSHTLECPTWSALNLKDNPQQLITFKRLLPVVTPLRVLLHMKNNEEAMDIICSMQSNKKKRYRMPVGKFIDAQIVKVIQEDLKKDLDRDLIHHICGVLDTNAFGITTKSGGKGRALFPLSSLMNHSCIANTQHWFTEGKFVVRASRAIASGDTITNCYTQVLWGTQARQLHMWTTKLFRCHCERCTDPTELGSFISSMKCRSCKTGNVVTVDPVNPESAWICHDCRIVAEFSWIGGVLVTSAGVLKNVDVKDSQLAQSVITRLGKTLTPTHYILTELKYSILNNYLIEGFEGCSEETLLFVFRTSEELLWLANCIEPGYTRLIGVLMLINLATRLERLRRLGIPRIESGMVEELSSELAVCGDILQYDVYLSAVNRLRETFKRLQGTSAAQN